MKLASLILALALVACGVGRTPLDPPDRGPPARGSGGSGAGGNGAGGTGQTGGSSGVTTAPDGTCYGNCTVPPGPLKLSPSLDELAAALVGVWQICSGGHAFFSGAPSDTIGVEFGPPALTDYGSWTGDLYFLRRGRSGPEHGDGPAYRQTYYLADDYTLSALSQNHDKSSSFELKYSMCPTQWWLESPHHADGSVTLAPF
jgi:hypothetical protein